MQSVFAPSTFKQTLARKRLAQQRHTPTANIRQPQQQPRPAAAAAKTEQAERRDEDGKGSDDDEEVDEASSYRAMMQELAHRAKLLEKQQLAAMAKTEERDDQEDDEHDQQNEEQSEEEAGQEVDVQDHQANEDEEEAEHDDDEEEEEEDDNDEQTSAAAAEPEGDAPVDEQAQEGEEESGEAEDEADDIDIDDPLQPATLLQTATDAEDEDDTHATSASVDSSSMHPELLSSDRFLSHFSHYRTLPADVLAQLTASTALLQPLPPIEGIREKLFAFNLQLFQEEHTSRMADADERKEEKAEEVVGIPVLTAPVWLRDLHVRPKIAERWQPITTKQKAKQRKKLSSATSASPALLDDDLPHPLQRSLFPLLSTYRDVVYPCLSPSTASSTFTPATHTAAMQAYCLHVVNHVVRAREAVLRHNAKLREWHKRQQEKRDKERLERQQQKQLARQSKQPRNKHTTPPTAADTAASALPPEYRDQGFTRCRVLILLPYAHFAYKVINCLLSLLPSTGKVDILNKRRYETEFSGEELAGPDNDKPADYRYLMTGELNDAFRVGLSLGSRGVRLYAPFHAADIIVASPLGLKLLLDGNEGHDWLSSVEVLVMDQCDVFGMQNWQHVDSCLQALNQLPKGQVFTTHTDDETADGSSGRVKQVEMDITRVKNYYLDNHSRYYRQTIVLGNHLSTDLHHLATHQLHNYAGLLLLRPLYTGILTRIHPPLNAAATTQRQIFHRFHVSALQRMYDDRFDYFTTHIFPTLKSNYESGGHIMIVVPHYSDFLRLRNHFKAKHYNFAALSEYTTNSNMSRHRSNFYHGRIKYLLMTERFYYYRRYVIRGCGHVVFYSLPQYSWCYEELVNAMGVGVGAAVAGASAGGGAIGSVGGGGLCVALYCVYDGRELERIVGTQRSLTMLSSEKSTYMFC